MSYEELLKSLSEGEVFNTIEELFAAKEIIIKSNLYLLLYCIF